MLYQTYLSTSLGYFEISGTDNGVRSVKKVGTPGSESAKLPACLKECKQQLQEYFERKRTHFKVKIDWGEATEFHKNVWEELLRIPYGQTTSYSAIAEKLGDPKKVRAVGQANGSNPITIIVPCHRVIAKNGDLQGYFYGLDMKRKLLELENPMSFASQGELF
jgi:methylated-DNA-[protein]-cysteine S-methyltransferase